MPRHVSARRTPTGGPRAQGTPKRLFSFVIAVLPTVCRSMKPMSPYNDGSGLSQADHHATAYTLEPIPHSGAAPYMAHDYRMEAAVGRLMP